MQVLDLTGLGEQLHMLVTGVSSQKKENTTPTGYMIS